MMRLRICFSLALFLTAAILTACRAETPSPADLALYHAPIHYQDTDDTLAEADYLTRFDYDGDWDALNNWENLETGDLSGAVYYSVVESCTHWFIVYGFFHPRDWTDTIEQEHENDMEGLLMVVRKDGGYGVLEGMVTVFHNDFYSFTPEDSQFREGGQDIDGEIAWNAIWFTPHPLTSAEAEGHGLKIWPLAGHFQGDEDEDGVIYYPSEKGPTVPRNGNDREARYELISFLAPGGLWERQVQEAQAAYDQALTFATWGTLKGDGGNASLSGGCGHGPSICKANAAHLPWAWDDHNDDPVFLGAMALDPANLVLNYFDRLGEFSTVYVSNPYLEGLRDAGFDAGNLPLGWPEGVDLEALYGKVGEGCE